MSVTPFIWLPAVKGTLSEGPVAIPLAASAGDLAKGIKLGGMVHAEAQTDNVQMSVQAIGLRFHDRQFQPVFGSDVATSLATMELLAGPRIRASKLELVPLAGARYTSIRGTINAPGLGSLIAAKTWSEGLLGIEGRIRVARRLSLRARSTFSFVGPSGQTGSDWIVAASYQLPREVSLIAGYRWSRERVLPGQANAFGLDLDARGPVLGLMVRL